MVEIPPQGGEGRGEGTRYGRRCWLGSGVRLVGL